jgi:Uma2 family endonuclease
MTVAAIAPPKQVRPDPFRVSVARFHELLKGGILAPEDRVELIEGEMLTKMSHNGPHAISVGVVDDTVSDALPPGWHVRAQLPITLARSEPEPDAAVVRGKRRDYNPDHPLPRHFGIVIEVSDSSLWYDRTVKGRLYAEAGIPEYWVVNIEERVVEVYTSPNPAATPAEYATRTDYAVGQSVPLALDGQQVGQLAVADLLP